MTVGTYKILIVDDSVEDRQACRRYLGRESIVDYRIIEAELGKEGLKLATSVKPDLILLDYSLPDCNGLEFIKELKLQVNQMPAIIMLTEQGSETIAVEAMKSGVKDYLVKGKLNAETIVTSVKSVLQQLRLQVSLAKSFQQQKLIAETALRIRKSLDLSEILNTAVKESRLLLNCDRVVIYKFAADLSGDIVAESICASWTKSLGQNIVDTCFRDNGTVRYKKGKTLVVDNVYEWGMSDCHLKLLEQFEVKAHIVAPLLLDSAPHPEHHNLWGLLIAHQCKDFRHWQADEVELLDKLGVQLAIAIQQAELLNSLQSELGIRKKLETELERLVQVLETSEDYISLTDVKGQLIWNNPRMGQLIGVENDAEIAKLSIAVYHPDWALKIVREEGIPTALTKGTWLGETAVLTQDGREIPVSQLIIAHKGADNRVKYISTVIRDLTMQKNTESSLEQKALELKWSNKELLKTTALLKKRNQELDRFAYITSHDLKAPLRAIANLATWLNEDIADLIPEENQQQLHLMQSRVKRMDNLIQGLLEYSRVGKKDTPIGKVNTKKLIAEVVDSLNPPPGFEIIVDDNLPVLKTKKLLLQQVFANLIGNAVKYHPQQQGEISISAADRDKFYQFSVADDGLGIDPQYHDRIFVIFQTLQARDTIESTGIGLSIVKKIVEGQGGKIWLDSQLDKGTTFYFTWRK